MHSEQIRKKDTTDRRLDMRVKRGQSAGLAPRMAAVFFYWRRYQSTLSIVPRLRDELVPSPDP